MVELLWELMGIAAEGLAKLLPSGHILSQKVLAKLLVLWIDPSTQEKQAQSFGQVHAYLMRYNSCTPIRSCRVILGDMFIPTLVAE